MELQYAITPSCVQYVDGNCRVASFKPSSPYFYSIAAMPTEHTLPTAPTLLESRWNEQHQRPPKPGITPW